MSLAWGSVALVVLLLPGFLFLIGLTWPEHFSRDARPRSLFAELAWLVLVAMLVHLGTIGLLELGTRCGGWDTRNPVENFATLTSGNSDNAELGRRAYGLMAPLACYVLGTTAIGFLLGALGGWLIVRYGWLRTFLTHAWVYDLRTNAAGHPASPTFAHVLSKIGPDNRRVLYQGPLFQFALTSDGSFSYLVLMSPDRHYFVIDEGGGAPTTTKGVSKIGTASGETDGGDCLLYIGGGEIENVVFDNPPMSDESETGNSIEFLDALIEGMIAPTASLKKMYSEVFDALMSKKDQDGGGSGDGE